MRTIQLTGLACCALLAALPQDDDKAQELLERAQLRYSQGKYPEVQRIYRDLAKKYGETEAGRIGARRSQPNAFLGYERFIETGPPANRVDVVLMGDGYLVNKQKVWDKLADNLPREFERNQTFGEYLSYFNFVRCNLVSEDDNVTGFGRTTSTALGGHVTGTIQGHIAVERKQVRTMLSEIPTEEHDDLVIAIVRAGSYGTGSTGIACLGAQNSKIAIHEWGHAFADLGDEYSEETHKRGGGRKRPNVSITDDPLLVPWAHWIAAKARGIGVYEGANGQVRGAWKPKPSGCVMQNGEFFCEPCREAVVLNIYAYVDPIESTNHPVHGDDSGEGLQLDEALEFEASVMTPASHKLEVDWYVLPERGLPAPPKSKLANVKDRRARGPLAPIPSKPDQSTPPESKGRSKFKLKPGDLDAGRYRVVLRVTDTTELRGDKLPWVLKDDHGVLESERGWWVRVP